MTATLTVLIVEDDEPQGFALKAALEANGFRSILSPTGAGALELVARMPSDLVLVDLGLPDVDGVQLCRHLRAQLSCPIIVVTANGDEQSMVKALDLGADDYIVKPVSVPVLLARIRVALRHLLVRAALVEEQIIRCGDISIDLSSREVRLGDEPIELLARPFDLLVALARNEGKLMTYRSLVRVCWGLDDTAERLYALRTAMSKLRKALGVGPARPVIVTQHNVGYRLVAP